MPHPRNLMKLTGDIHPPEVEYDLDDRAEEDAVPTTARRTADVPRAGTVATPEPMAFAAPAPAAGAFEDAARAQVRRNPLATLGAAFVLGFVLVKLFR